LEGVASLDVGVDVGEGDPDRVELGVRFVVGADDEGLGRNDLASDRDLLVQVGVWGLGDVVGPRMDAEFRCRWAVDSSEDETGKRNVQADR